jgi:4-hydroxybenzoate polyprenyltransferase
MAVFDCASRYVGRMRIYLREMYSFPKHLVSALLIYVSFTALLKMNYGVRAPFPTLYSLVGTMSIFLFLLILRLMDELKDIKIDLELFPSRPVSSGRVLASDIRLALGVAIACFLALNSLDMQSWWMSLGLLGYAILMFRYFFVPDILRKDLILNLLTHNPVVPILFMYLVVLFAAEHSIQLDTMDWEFNLLLCLMYWGMSFAWEIARKIRAEAEENTYVTYSQLFGKRGAVAIAASAQTLTVCSAVFIAWLESFSGLYVVVCLIGYCVAVMGYVRFLYRPTPMTSRLRPFAESFMLVIALAGCVEFLLMGGAR